MTHMTSPDQGDSPSTVASEIMRRLAWLALVFAGTLCAYMFATNTNVCQVCLPKPLSNALLWAVAGGLFVLALQTLHDGRKGS